jgi:hypothetical protein
MTHCEPLFWYGIFVLAVVAGLAFVPYLRGKAELVSAWNLLLAGIGIFVGIGAIEAATHPMRFKAVQWFEPTQSEVLWWAVATTIFLISVVASHRYDPVSRKLAQHCFNKWPPITTGVMLFVVFLCFFLALASRTTIFWTVPVFGPVVKNISHKAMIFCVVFAFLLWYRNRINLLWLALFIVIFLSICFVAMLVSGGRRLVLSVFLGPVLVFYFYQARNWRPIKCMSAITVGMVCVFCISLIYSSVRHFDRRGENTVENKDRSAASALNALRNIQGTGWFERFANDMLWSLSQHVVHYGMLADHYVRNGDLEAQPLNTFKFMAVYPIPRQLWQNKPRSLGHIITHQMIGRETTWGTGVAGHSAYEGGLIVAALFGYFAAFGARFFDDPMMRQPTNPFLIAMLSAAAMHIIAWPRGDLAVMTFEVAECFFFTIGLAWLCRFLVGTDKSWIMNRAAIPSSRAVYHAPTR